MPALVDRRAWLDRCRAEAVAFFDTGAATYDSKAGRITKMQRRFVKRLIESCPSGGRILDAPIGSGRYLPMMLAAGLRVVGIDQSVGMLARARAKGPDVPLSRVGLQELGAVAAFRGAFDGVLCTDAMEFIPPEAWPLVLRNLRRAVRPGGLLYLTVGQFCEGCVVEGYAERIAEGLPIVPGEYLLRGDEGYHFYPPSRWLADRLADAGLEIVEEARSAEGDYDEHHLLLR